MQAKLKAIEQLEGGAPAGGQSSSDEWEFKYQNLDKRYQETLKLLEAERGGGGGGSSDDATVRALQSEVTELQERLAHEKADRAAKAKSLDAGQLEHWEQKYLEVETKLQEERKGRAELAKKHKTLRKEYLDLKNSNNAAASDGAGGDDDWDSPEGAAGGSKQMEQLRSDYQEQMNIALSQQEESLRSQYQAQVSLLSPSMIDPSFA